MSEYELVDILGNLGSGIFDITSMFITIFFAYVVCVYLVGSKISRFQIIALSAIYSAFSFFLTYLVINSMFRMAFIIARLSESDAPVVPLYQYIGPGILLLTWLLSIIYAYQVRASANKVD